MKKNYDEYAVQVTGCNTLFQDEVKKKADDLNKINADWRYSPKGKQEKKEAVYKELQGVADNLTKVYKEACKRFMADFAITLPEDGKDHSIDIQNALQIVDMLGFDLDVANLNNILNPLKGSFRNMKTVVDVVRTKNQTSFSGQYSDAVMNRIDEMTGLHTSIYDYLDFIRNIQEIIDNPAGYRFEAETVGNAPVTYIRDVIPYSFLACPDWMKEAGERYAVLEDEFSSLFQMHIPTDAEMIEDILK